MEDEPIKYDETNEEASEIVLFKGAKCDVYAVPSNDPYRSAKWNIDEPFWEGVLKLTSKGNECIITIEDESSGEPYVLSVFSDIKLNPVRPAIDCSRYFVLRVDKRTKKSETVSEVRYIAVGIRDDDKAFDFIAALHDHIRYLEKNEAAKEMRQNPSVDYRLKEGESLVLQMEKIFDHGLKNLSLEDKSTIRTGVISLAQGPPTPRPGQLPPPPPPRRPSPVPVENPFSHMTSRLNLDNHAENEEGAADDDFGEFQKCLKRKWDDLA